MIQENNTTSQDQEDAIDIIALLKNLWTARKIILKITLAFTFLGLFVAVFSKNEFTAATTFVPLAQGTSVGGGSLGSLASLAGINIGSISYAKTLSRRFGTLHGSIKYLDYGTIIGADEFGVETGNFSANDIAISLGYAYNIPRSNIFIGANIKFINATINNYTSIGTAFDFAMLYYREFNPLSMTIVVRNIGTQLKSFNGVQEKIPLKIAFGVSYRLKYVPLKWYGTFDNLQQWDISVANPSSQTVDLEGNVTKEDINFLNNMFRHIIIGAELFPESLINILVFFVSKPFFDVCVPI